MIEDDFTGSVRASGFTAQVIEAYAGLGECHRLTPIPPDGPKLDDAEAERWEQHIAKRLEAGQWRWRCRRHWW